MTINIIKCEGKYYRASDHHIASNDCNGARWISDVQDGQAIWKSLRYATTGERMIPDGTVIKLYKDTTPSYMNNPDGIIGTWKHYKTITL